MTVITGLIAFLFGFACGLAAMIAPIVLADDYWHKRYKELEHQIREERELGERKG